MRLSELIMPNRLSLITNLPRRYIYNPIQQLINSVFPFARSTITSIEGYALSKVPTSLGQKYLEVIDNNYSIQNKSLIQRHRLTYKQTREDKQHKQLLEEFKGNLQIFDRFDQSIKQVPNEFPALKKQFVELQHNGDFEIDDPQYQEKQMNILNVKRDLNNRYMAEIRRRIDQTRNMYWYNPRQLNWQETMSTCPQTQYINLPNCFQNQLIIYQTKLIMQSKTLLYHKPYPLKHYKQFYFQQIAFPLRYKIEQDHFDTLSFQQYFVVKKIWEQQSQDKIVRISNGNQQIDFVELQLFNSIDNGKWIDYRIVCRYIDLIIITAKDQPQLNHVKIITPQFLRFIIQYKFTPASRQQMRIICQRNKIYKNDKLLFPIIQKQGKWLILQVSREGLIVYDSRRRLDSTYYQMILTRQNTSCQIMAFAQILYHSHILPSIQINPYFPQITHLQDNSITFLCGLIDIVRGYQQYFTCRSNEDIKAKRVQIARDLLWGRVVGLRGSQYATKYYGQRRIQDYQPYVQQELVI